MKILHVITSLRAGGAEKLMTDLLPLFSTKGIDVELAVFDATPTPFMDALNSAGIKLHLFNRGGSVYNPRHIMRLRRLIKDYDIIHTHNTAPQIFGAIANIGKRKIMVTTEHNTTNRRRGNRMLRLIDRWMYRQYDHVICISQGTAEALEEHLGRSQPNISIVENGINTDAFLNAMPANVLSSISGSDSRKIVMVAGFRDQKDHPTLIKAMQHLPENFHLFLIGDGERRQEYEQLVEKLDMTHRVHLMGVRTDIPSLLKESDYIVISSHYEGFCLVAAEGMCSGKPFIATDVPVLSTLVGGAALLFKENDPADLARKIMTLEKDETLRNIVSMRCVERGRRYDISHMAAGYISIYHNLITDRNDEETS